MSLGTNIKSNMLSKEILSNILQTFAVLTDYNFIWKFESKLEELPITPSKNVLIQSFLPQNDTLAHPNVKAFITHSGLLSTQESLWNGKPMIAVPFFCDQDRTAGKSVQLNVALKIDFQRFDGFKETVLKILKDPIYAESAQNMSRLFQDKTEKPLNTAIWWIEYIIRNPDASQYQSPALKLGWFASHANDIFLTVLAVIHLAIFVTFKVAKFIIKVFKSPEAKKIKIK